MPGDPLTDREIRILRGLIDEHLDRITHRRDGSGVAPTVSHALIAIALLIGYVALTIHGDDATPLLSALGAYLVGAGVQRAIRRNGD